MFTKKLLSVISTLFIGSQLLSFANAGVTALTPCSDGALALTNSGALSSVTTGCTFGETSYCLSGTSIYGYTSSGGNTATCVIDKEGTYVLLGDSKLNSETIDAGNKDTLKIYQCTGVSDVKCLQTFGYVLSSGNQYLTINASGTNAFVAIGDIATVDSLSGGDCTDGVLYNDSGNIQLCLGGKIYSQKIDETSIIKSYVLNNVEGNIFTNAASDDPNKDKPMVVNVGDNKIILSTNAYDYCAGSNSEVSETFKEFCSDTVGNDPCTDSPYECESTGICKREGGGSAVVGCSIVIGSTSSGCTANGYYLITAATDNTYTPSESANGYLVNCSTETTCTVVPDDGTFKIGYYKYADKENKYIKCEAYGDCSVITVHTSATGCNDDEDIDGTPDYNIGDIINNGSNDILCLDNTISDGITLGTVAEYLAGSTSIFTSAAGKYVKIEASTYNSVVLSTPGKKDNAKSYYYTNTTYKIHAKADKSVVCAASKTIIEFKFDESGSTDDSLIVYDKHAEHTFPNA